MLIQTNKYERKKPEHTERESTVANARKSVYFTYAEGKRQVQSKHDARTRTMIHTK